MGSKSLEQDPRFDEMWTLVRSQALLSQRLADLDHQVQPLPAVAAPEAAQLVQVACLLCVAHVVDGYELG